MHSLELHWRLITFWDFRKIIIDHSAPEKMKDRLVKQKENELGNQESHSASQYSTNKEINYLSQAPFSKTGRWDTF